MTINVDYIKLFTKITAFAAYEASLFIGKNDKIAADKAAVDSMRSHLNKIDMNGTIVIGEGELDEAPMLFIGEKIGTGKGIELDIAVDPVEGTNFVAKNLPNSIAVIAVSRKGDLLNAPETYMDKIVIGPNLPKNLIDLDYDIETNISNLAKAKNKKNSELTACLLERPRHKKIIDKLKSLGVNLNLITDGDVMGALAVANNKNNIDIFLGTGGAPEGVLAAAALSCLNCQMQARLVFQNENEKKRASDFGIKNLNKKYNLQDMIKGDVIFCATAITDGNIIKGIKDFDKYFRAETLVAHKSSKTFSVITENIIK